MSKYFEPSGLGDRQSLRTAVRVSLYRGRHASLLTSANAIIIGALSMQSPMVSAQTASVMAAESGLEEIVVTAQRRNQSLQSVPYNISVVDPSQLALSGATTLNDLTRVVPGLVTVDTGEGARGRTNNLTLRGIRTDSPGGGPSVAEVPGQSVSPVSTYFGETPVFFPMPLYDVERVEVLRGPQGTLYGSGSQAGTIRFVPTRPQFGKLGGQVELTASDTQHASEWSNLNRDIKGFINIPLADHLAARIVAGREHDGGFINNVDLFQRQSSGVLGAPTPSIPHDLTSGPVIGPEQHNTNTADQWFARGALRWQASDALDVQLDYVHQKVDSANAQYSTPDYPGGTLDLTTANPTPPGPGNPGQYPHSSFNLKPGDPYASTAFTLSPYHETTDLVSAVATMDLGLATITSASSYYDDKSFSVSDYTPAFFSNAGFNFNLYPPYNFYPRLLPIMEVSTNEHSFVQELRLVSNGTNTFDYVVGGFFQDQVGQVRFDQYAPGIKDYLAATNQANPSKYGDQNWLYLRDTAFKDLAAFGELTWHINPAWQVTGGLRFFHQTFDTNSSSRFYLCGALCSNDTVDPTGLSTAASSYSTSKTIKKLNSSYDISPTLKLYATYSEGFRRGGANALPLSGIYATLPVYQTFAPDFAKNYEIGVKGSLFDRRVTYAADLYRINISNFQFDGEDFSYFPATYNGKGARTQGFELELHASVTKQTQVSFGFTYTDAKVTDTFELLDYPSYATIPSLGGTGQTAPLFNGPITSGTRLPGIPLTTYSGAIDHTVPLSIGRGDPWSLKLHIDGAFRSSTSATILTSTPFNWTIPQSFSGNLRASMATGGALSYDVFVNNFTDCLCYSGGQNIQAYPNYSRDRYIARPRTFGLALRYTF